MAKRQKLIHIHSNVYTSGNPQAPTTGTLAKGEIAINYNDTEPAMFIENNSGGLVKFNAIQRSEINAITGETSSLRNDLDSVKEDNKIKLNGTQKSLTGTTWEFYAPTSSGSSDSVLLSDGANKAPKWVAQSSLSVGTASTANKVAGVLTLSGNGTTILTYDGSANTGVNITYSTVGAAPSSHSHNASALPTATTSAYGITKLGTSAGTAAEGNHTHSEYVNPAVTNCAQTLSWGTEVTAATIGDKAITIKAMAKPTYTYNDVGAAAASHNHGASDLPTASTSAYGITKLGTAAGTAAEGNHTHPSYANPTVTNKSATWAWGDTVTAATIGSTAITIAAPAMPTYGDVGAAPSTHSHTAADLPSASTTDKGIIKIGTTANDAAAGNHTHPEYVNPTVTNKSATWSWGNTVTAATIGSTSITIAAPAMPTYGDVGAAPSTHSHVASALPTATTTAYGITKLGTAAGTAAEGNHTHSAYVNPTVTNCAQTLSWGTEVTAATIGSTAITIKAMAKPTYSYSDVGAAASSHNHGASDLPTASTSAYGVTKLGTGAGTAAEGNHTHPSYANPTVTNKSATWSWGNTVTAATIGSTAITIAAPAMPTYGDVGAAPSTHSHVASALPTASTTDFGIVKIGTASGTVAAGDHTHSAYVNPTVTNCGQTLSWGTEVTAATIGNTAITIKAMAKPTYTYTDVGAAPSTHSHVASALPTATTTAYGITKLGTGAGTAAEGNHTHPSYVNPTVTNCGETLSWGTTITAATIGSTAITIKAMAKPTYSYSDVGAAPASHSHLIADLPTASTFTSDASKVPTQKQVKDYVDGLVASPVNYKGAVTNGSLPSSPKVGDLYIVQTSNITIASGSSATGAAQTAETGDYIIARTTSKWDVIQKNLTGAVTSNDSLTDGNFVLGNGNQVIKNSSYGPNSFAAKSHSHTATDLPTASTSAYGITKLGTDAGTAAEGNHTHPSYVNPTVTNKSATWSWGNTVTAATIGSTSITIAAPAMPTYGDVGAAPSTHSHAASALPTASTSAFGIVKIGTASGTVAAGDHTHSAYVNPTVTNKNATWSWGNTVTAATIGSTSITIAAPAKPTYTYSDVGAAPTSHSHTSKSDIADSDKVDGYHVAVVTSMPSTPDANTIYILK